MTKPNPKDKLVRVEKTDKLNQMKLQRIARRYNITPISVREIQLGFPEDIPVAAADLLVKDGYVKRVKADIRSNQVRVDSLAPKTTELTEPVTNVDDLDVLAADGGDSVTGDPKTNEEQV